MMHGDTRVYPSSVSPVAAPPCGIVLRGRPPFRSAVRHRCDSTFEPARSSLAGSSCRGRPKIITMIITMEIKRRKQKEEEEGRRRKEKKKKRKMGTGIGEKRKSEHGAVLFPCFVKIKTARRGERERERGENLERRGTISVTSLHSCDGKLPDHPESHRLTRHPWGLNAAAIRLLSTA